MICSNNVRTKDQSVESSSCYCKVEEEEQGDQKYTSQGKWNEQSQIIVTTYLAFGAAQDETKSFYTLPTQQPGMIETTLLIRVVQVNVLALSGTVVKWTVNE